LVVNLSTIRHRSGETMTEYLLIKSCHHKEYYTS
jgi:hypothetical protein